MSAPRHPSSRTSALAAAFAAALAASATAADRPVLAQGYPGPTDTLPSAATSGQAAPAAAGSTGLEERLAILERKLEIKDEEAAAKAKEASTASSGPEGYGLKGPDASFQFRWRGGIQTDGRYYQDGADARVPDTYLIRRVRPIIDVVAWKHYGIRIVPDFGGGTVALVDAFVDANWHPAFKARFGKFIPPFSIERLQAFTDAVLVEGSHAVNFAPNREPGLQIHGDLFNERLSYAVASYAGSPDGASWDADNNSPKDVAVRLFAHPFKTGEIELLRGLGLGAAATYGAHNGDTVGGSSLASYRSPGQQIFFRYAQDRNVTVAGTTVADGDKLRLAPQGYWYAGSFGILGEYVWNREAVRRGDRAGELEHTAWQATASWVLTGETPGYRALKPRHAFLQDGGLGAIELTGGISRASFDPEAFEGATPYASPAQSAEEATSYVAGVNWHLSRSFRLSFNYDYTQFEGGAANGGDRAEEKVFLNRVTVTF